MFIKYLTRSEIPNPKTQIIRRLIDPLSIVKLIFRIGLYMKMTLPCTG